jgi:hypothetical protein
VSTTTGKRSAGRRVAEKAVRPGNRRPVALLLVGALLTLVVWWFLVRFAVDFVQLALYGEPMGWVFGGAASLGAVGCLLLTLALGARALRVLGLVSDYRPRRAGARRKA